MKPSRRTVLTGASVAAAAPGMAFAAPGDGGEFIGPLAGWLDARRDFGAVGDGKADDTAALQWALDSLVDAKGKACALWLPAGTYRITRTLVLLRKGAREAIGLNIQGEDPARTTIRWDGAADAAMFDYGAWYSKIGRITLDGAGRAGTALKHGSEFVTGNEIADMVFRDVGYGIEAGSATTAGIAETSVQRCRFIRCSKAGASLQNFNSLDFWFWHCRFEACRVGLTNWVVAGNFHAYGCLFLGSTEADITMRNTGYLSFRDNVSIGSKAFFVAARIVAAAQLTFQRNRIYDTAEAAAIQVGNLGPILMFDNVIASRAKATSPAVVAPAATTVSVGNQYTVKQALAVKAGSVRLDERVVARGGLSATPPAMPGTPARFTGRVIELAAGADAGAIQRAIDAAAKSGRATVIHLLAGVFNIERTLTIPAKCDVRLVGEGMPYQTRLEWKGVGAGPVIRLLGPSRASVSGLVVNAGPNTDGIVVEGCDQPGSRVWMDQVQPAASSGAGFLFDRLQNLAVRLRDGGHSGCGVGVKVIGRGEGRPTARAVILSGASSNNELSYDVSQGGRLLARDIWYESGKMPGFMKLTDSGEFTLNGSNVALARSLERPAIDIAGFRGKAAFLCVCFSRTDGDEDWPEVVTSGRERAQQVLLLGCHGNGEYFADRSSAGRAVRANSVKYTPGGGAKTIEDVGAVDGPWLRDMLAAVREPLSIEEPVSLAAGLADVRLVRVYVGPTRNGIHLKG